MPSVSEKEPWLLVVSPSLKAFSAARIVDYYRSRMQIEEGLRDTKSTHYGLYFTNESRIEAERRANLLLINCCAHHFRALAYWAMFKRH